MIPIDYNGITYGLLSETELKAYIYIATIFGMSVMYLIIAFSKFVFNRTKAKKKYIKSLDDKQYRKYTEYLKS